MSYLFPRAPGPVIERMASRRDALMAALMLSRFDTERAYRIAGLVERVLHRLKHLEWWAELEARTGFRMEAAR